MKQLLLVVFYTEKKAIKNNWQQQQYRTGLVMKLINAEPKENYIVRVYLDNQSILDFDVKAELERISCYRALYNVNFFNTVKFKNQRIFWNEDFDFHLDQIVERGRSIT